MLQGQLHLGRDTWNLKMDLWKTTFLYNPVVFRFYVNLPGCILYGYRPGSNLRRSTVKGLFLETVRHTRRSYISVKPPSKVESWLHSCSKALSGAVPWTFPKLFVCVCVSHPGQRVFHHHSFHFTQAGACGLLVLPHAMKLWTRRGSRD